MWEEIPPRKGGGIEVNKMNDTKVLALPTNAFPFGIGCVQILEAKGPFSPGEVRNTTKDSSTCHGDKVME